MILTNKAYMYKQLSLVRDTFSSISYAWIKRHIFITSQLTNHLLFPNLETNLIKGIKSLETIKWRRTTYISNEFVSDSCSHHSSTHLTLMYFYENFDIVFFVTDKYLRFPDPGLPILDHVSLSACATCSGSLTCICQHNIETFPSTEFVCLWSVLCIINLSLSFLTIIKHPYSFVSLLLPLQFWLKPSPFLLYIYSCCVMGATILPVLLQWSRILHSCWRCVHLSSYSTILSIQKSRDYDVTMNCIDDTIMR